MDEQDNKTLVRLERYLQLAVCLALIVILGSCVSEISEVGGGHDSNQKMAGIFFFHLFLVVPCLFGFFVFLRVKLEKYLLSKETIESLNKTHMIYAQQEASKGLGSLFPFFRALFKKPKK